MKMKNQNNILFFRQLENNYLNKIPSSFFTWASQVCKYKEYEYGKDKLKEWYNIIPKSNYILKNTFIVLILFNGNVDYYSDLNLYDNLYNDIKDPVYSLEKIEYTIFDAVGLTDLENNIKQNYNIEQFNTWKDFIINNKLYQHAELVIHDLLMNNIEYPNMYDLIDENNRYTFSCFHGITKLDY